MLTAHRPPLHRGLGCSSGAVRPSGGPLASLHWSPLWPPGFPAATGLKPLYVSDWHRLPTHRLSCAGTLDLHRLRLISTRSTPIIARHSSL